jgi:arsenate reductase
MSRLKSEPVTPALAPPRHKSRVLFVCIGNSCRSQMAEGLARKYGSDVMEPHSAGVAPATTVADLTKKVMAGRGIDLSAAFPKSVFDAPGSWDLIVNMSGYPIPNGLRAFQFREWKVQDPIGLPESIYNQVAATIESRVMQLILELRN